MQKILRDVPQTFVPLYAGKWIENFSFRKFVIQEYNSRDLSGVMILTYFFPNKVWPVYRDLRKKGPFILSSYCLVTYLSARRGEIYI